MIILAAIGAAAVIWFAAWLILRWLFPRGGWMQ